MATKFRQWITHNRAEHQANAPILELADVSVRYESGSALEGISFRLAAGERVAVVGPNGAGKSTLFKVIAGVQRPSAGEVSISGYGPGGHICIAYVPQRNQVDWHFPVTVADVVMMGRIGQLGWLRRPRQRDWRFVRECLAVVGLADLSDRPIGQLSGGQQQRMFVARALAQEADLMLMDEPLTGLDVTAQDDIFRILDALRERGVTVMVALHDLNMAAEHFDRVMLLNRRLLGFGAAADVFQPEALTRAYGSHLHFIHTADGVIAVDDTCCEDGAALDEQSV
jgi:manganese/iron transport system ATP-binding protein